MPLTPQDVQNKRFTVVRFKSGYDEEEVDSFLDEIEEELRRLIAENTSLRQTSAAAAHGATPQSLTATPPPMAPPPPPPAPTPAATPARAPGPSAEEAGDAALKTLVLAQKTAEEAIAQAHTEAEGIVNTARQKASALEQEAQAAHVNRLASLEHDRRALEAEVAALRSFEREFRSRLRAYLESSMHDLDARPSVEPAAPPSAGSRPPAGPPPTPPTGPGGAAAPPPTPPTGPGGLPASASAAPAFAAGPAPVPATPVSPQPPAAAPPAAAPPAQPTPAPAPPAAAPPAQPTPAPESDAPTAELPRSGETADRPIQVPSVAPPASHPSGFTSQPVASEGDEAPSGPPAQA